MGPSLNSCSRFEKIWENLYVDLSLGYWKTVSWLFWIYLWDQTRRELGTDDVTSKINLFLSKHGNKYFNRKISGIEQEKCYNHNFQ